MTGRDVRHRFASFPVLRTPRLLLREVGTDDLPDVREITFYDGAPAASDAEAADMLHRIDEDAREGRGVQWGVCLVATGTIVGTCSFHHGYPDDVAEIGYVLRPAFRGRGIMTEAVRAVVRFGLDEMGLAGIRALVTPDNEASAAVLQRAGFTEVASEGGQRVFLVRREVGATPSHAEGEAAE